MSSPSKFAAPLHPPPSPLQRWTRFNRDLMDPELHEEDHVAAPANYSDAALNKGPLFKVVQKAIVRERIELTSPKVIDLDVGTKVHIVDTQRMADATHRVHVVLMGQHQPIGWLTARRAERLADGARGRKQSLVVLQQVHSPTKAGEESTWERLTSRRSLSPSSRSSSPTPQRSASPEPPPLLMFTTPPRPVGRQSSGTTTATTDDKGAAATAADAPSSAVDVS